MKPVFVVNIYLMSIWWVFIVCRVEIKIWQTPTRWRRVETLRLCCQWKLEKQLRKLWLNCAFDFIIYFSIYFVIHANWLLIDLSCDCLTFVRCQSMGLSPTLPPSLPFTATKFFFCQCQSSIPCCCCRHGSLSTVKKVILIMTNLQVNSILKFIFVFRAFSAWGGTWQSCFPPSLSLSLSLSLSISVDASLNN